MITAPFGAVSSAHSRIIKEKSALRMVSEDLTTTSSRDTARRFKVPQPSGLQARHPPPQRDRHSASPAYESYDAPLCGLISLS